MSVGKIKIPVDNALKKRRVPNAFMLFVKEQKHDLVKQCPEQNKSAIGTFLGKKWRCLRSTEKQVYYDRYSMLKKVATDKSANLQYTEGQSDDMSSETKDGLSGLVQSKMYKKKKNKNCVNDATVNNEDTKFKKFHTEAVPENNGISNQNNGISSETNSIPQKPKPKKITKKPLNAFIVFANEFRKKLSQNQPKGKQSHISRVLGDMWKQLQATDKEKYYSEARRLCALQRDKLQGLSSKVCDVEHNLKGKSYMKIKVKKSAPRKLLKKPKERFSKRLLNANELQAQFSKESIATKQKQESVSKPSRMEANLKGEECKISETQPIPGPGGFNLQTPNSSGSSPYPGASCSNILSSACHCQHSSSSKWLPNLKSASNLQYPSYGGMNNPCCTSGLPYPLISPYQMSDPAFWMYRQSFGMHPHHFSGYMSPVYSPYNCSFPYFPYPGSYYSAYSERVFSERFGGQYPDKSRLGCSFDNSIRKEDSVFTEPPNTSGSINNSNDRGSAVPPVYCTGSNCSKAESTIVIESANNSTKRDNQIVEGNCDDDDDEVSLGSHTLVIVDEEDENGELRQDPDVNAH